MYARGYLRTHHSFARRLVLTMTGLALTLGALPALTGALPGTGAGTARADDVTASQDALRTGWDPNDAGLTPAIVGGGTFQNLFKTPVNGQVYAQPVVVPVGASNHIVIVATENDYVYGLDPATGVPQWTTHLGNPFVLAKARWKKVRTCKDLTPNIGVTGTPAYDPVTKDVYMFGEIMVGKYPKYYLYGINPSTGTVDMKVAISGKPSNNSKITFNPQAQMERPGVLVQDGAAYGAFASHCDRSPYSGYVARVSLPGGALRLWTDESGVTNKAAGIWQGGGGIMSDGPGRYFVTSGNGVSPGPAKGSSPPGQLAESVIRLAVNSSGKMSARDFFSPANAPKLDAADTDYGSGGPVGLPFGTSGTTNYPDILAQAGKDGRIFLLNRDNLGGREQGPGKTDAVLAVTKAYGGEWGHPAVFADTTTLTAANASTANDYLYFVGRNDALRVFKFGADSSGKPTLSNVADSTLSFGYTSGSPVVTSDGTKAATEVLWEVFVNHSTGLGGILEAYDVSSTALAGCTSAKPCSLKPIWNAPLGTVTKFSIPATSGGRVYVGTRDGKVYGFGVPGAGSSLVTAPTATFAQTGVNATSVRQVTVTADRKVTFTGVTASTGASNSLATTDQFTVGAITETRKGTTTAVPVTFPVTLHKGDKLHAAVTFGPLAPGGVTGSVSFATTSTKTPSVDVPLTGDGTQAGLVANPSTVTFPLAPDQGVTDVPVGIGRPEVVQIANYGPTTETVASVTPPSSPFSATGLPAAGTQIKPGQSITVQVTYAPTAAGPATGSFTITGADSTSVTVNLSGSGAAPVTSFTVNLSGTGAAIRHLAPASSSVNLGTVRVGKTATASIHVTNSGNQPSTITATTPLATPFHTAYRIPKGLPFNPSYDLTQRVAFTPVKKGTFTTHYTLTWTDPRGTHTLTVTLTGKAT